MSATPQPPLFHSLLLRLATVELQLCSHYLDAQSLLQLMRCSRRTLADCSQEFAWRHSIVRVPPDSPGFVARMEASLSARRRVGALLPHMRVLHVERDERVEDELWAELLASHSMRQLHVLSLAALDSPRTLQAACTLPHLHTLRFHVMPDGEHFWTSLHTAPSLTDLSLDFKVGPRTLYPLDQLRALPPALIKLHLKHAQRALVVPDFLRQLQVHSLRFLFIETAVATKRLIDALRAALTPTHLPDLRVLRLQDITGLDKLLPLFGEVAAASLSEPTAAAASVPPPPSLRLKRVELVILPDWNYFVQTFGFEVTHGKLPSREALVALSDALTAMATPMQIQLRYRSTLEGWLEQARGEAFRHLPAPADQRVRQQYEHLQADFIDAPIPRVTVKLMP